MAATRSVLGGLGIVEGGFKLNVSPAAWERRNRYMQSSKLAEVRLNGLGTATLLVEVWKDLKLVSACRVELRLSLSLVRGVELR